ncbi:hypothetical protein [Marinibactrum halimedae]|uniref:Uncharacterized protein n=1 Tax=Marinibactrum halimedae TaxID=1444977 RepID=A0AA37WQH8_9GAMM|nr:hypothetical protein [Marinibactrum halimedae]MCD9459235.1 hypothetical protein [Marinibactrum halimedae]GLS27307.1 hypothetical protein GCM10007877_30260 [Marinibactrum halimedae]
MSEEKSPDNDTIKNLTIENDNVAETRSNKTASDQTNLVKEKTLSLGQPNDTQPNDSQPNYTVEYTISGTPINKEDLPPNARHQVFYSTEEEGIAYIEDISFGHLRALENFATSNKLKTEATKTLEAALNNGVEFDAQNGIEINLYLPQTEFELGFELAEHENAAPQTHFFALPNDDGEWEVEPKYYAFSVEIIRDEPTIQVVKRALYDQNQQLMGFEYPLMGIPPHINIPDHLLTFIEYTPVGEQQELEHFTEDDKADLLNGDRYLLPANSDDQLALMQPYFAYEHVMVTDAFLQPIPEPEIPNHPDANVLNFNPNTESLKSTEHILSHGIASTNLYNVPVELHWHAYHAYLRAISEEMRLISSAPKAEHTVRVFSSASKESLPGIELQPNEHLLRSSGFLFTGKRVNCDIVVYNSETNAALRSYEVKNHETMEIINETVLEPAEME